MDFLAKHIRTPLGELMAAVTQQGVCRIAFPAKAWSRLYPWFDRYFGGIPQPGDSPLLDDLHEQLNEYFAASRRDFELPLDLRGTDFQLAVWGHLRAVPFGRTVTYGELARKLGIGGGARAIGRAVGDNPVPILVPCHRVLGSGGLLVGFSGGVGAKERLLELEGVRIPFHRRGTRTKNNPCGNL